MDYFKKRSQQFSALRFTLVLLSVVFVIVTAIREYFRYEEVKSLTGKIWSIDPQSGQVTSLSKVEYTAGERVAEYKDHVRSFIDNFYEYDQYTFLENMDNSRPLMDKESFEKEINKYKENRVLEELQDRNITLTVSDIKIDINIQTRPVSGYLYFVQTLRGPNNISRERVFEARFKLKDTEGRSYENSHAASIYDYTILRKEIIEE